MSKSAIVSDFVRDAVREKAMRELESLNQRASAFGSIERSRDALYTVSSELSTALSAIASVTPDTAVNAKVKKLRKLVEDAHLLATEVGDALGIDAHREASAGARKAIMDALKAAGIDPTAVADAPAIADEDSGEPTNGSSTAS